MAPMVTFEFELMDVRAPAEKLLLPNIAAVWGNPRRPGSIEECGAGTLIPSMFLLIVSRAFWKSSSVSGTGDFGAEVGGVGRGGFGVDEIGGGEVVLFGKVNLSLNVAEGAGIGIDTEGTEAVGGTEGAGL